MECCPLVLTTPTGSCLSLSPVVQGTFFPWHTRRFDRRALLNLKTLLTTPETTYAFDTPWRPRDAALRTHLRPLGAGHAWPRHGLRAELLGGFGWCPTCRRWSDHGRHRRRCGGHWFGLHRHVHRFVFGPRSRHRGHGVGGRTNRLGLLQPQRWSGSKRQRAIVTLAICRCPRSRAALGRVRQSRPLRA